ncbi:MAG: flagellar hook capping FlgD N-terminal domain-containing protein [Pyrinomonadaceae bacterium]
MSNIATDAISLASTVLSAAKDARALRQQQQTTAAVNSATDTKQVADRDMFLKLLVTQLKHQDPLAPQDGAQFVAQLAQFNSLDQLININSRLDQIIDKK